MPRYTAAYSRLKARLPEIEALNALAKKNARIVPTPSTTALVRALSRGSIVLLSSHIEGYVEDLAEVILERIHDRKVKKSRLAPRFLYFFSKDILDDIFDTKDPDKISNKLSELFIRDNDIWSKNDLFDNQLPLDRFISDFSNPTFERIKLFMGRFGYADYRRDLGRHLKMNFQPCINMIDHIIAQRNKIAHGDPAVAASPADVSDMLDLVRMFCSATDDVVGRWFKERGCSIR